MALTLLWPRSKELRQTPTREKPWCRPLKWALLGSSLVRSPVCWSMRPPRHPHSIHTPYTLPARLNSPLRHASPARRDEMLALSRFISHYLALSRLVLPYLDSSRLISPYLVVHTSPARLISSRARGWLLTGDGGDGGGGGGGGGVGGGGWRGRLDRRYDARQSAGADGECILC